MTNEPGKSPNNAGQPAAEGMEAGSLTARDSSTPRDIGAPDGAFRFLLRRRRPGVSFLRG